MTKKIDTAVILAAGLGSRLGDIKGVKPKAFLEIDGLSLIHRSIQSLKSKGISSIIIGTGYENRWFDELKTSNPCIVTLRNSKYDRTGSMYTLYLLKNLITKPFLLLEADLLYEHAALDFLLDDAKDEVILASGATQSGDEVFIQTDNNGLLQDMSKNKSVLSKVSGELVGITKLSLAGLNAMCGFAESKYKTSDFAIHYEDAMVGASNNFDFHVKAVSDLAWCEIDDEQHLKRAIEVVYPKIKSRG